MLGAAIIIDSGMIFQDHAPLTTGDLVRTGGAALEVEHGR
jgi:hypothetical protein